jgi:hypothetical protein
MKAKNDINKNHLQFTIAQSGAFHTFYRHGLVATHISIFNGISPNITFSFPAGNNRIDAMFSTNKHTKIELVQDSIKPIEKEQNKFWGVELELVVTTKGTVNKKPKLSMGNSRDLRENKGTVKSNELNFNFEWIDTTRIKLVALNSATPLTPITATNLFTSNNIKNLQLAQILEYLTYEEKMLAGSPHYTTYFGRDTLLSLLLLMPVLQPKVIETVLGSVFARMNDKGEIAHEEDYRQKPTLYEYNMVDEDLLLAPVVIQYLTRYKKDSKQEFLAKYKSKLKQNFDLITNKAKNYATTQSKRDLIGLKPDHFAGNWRDSHQGLGRGGYSGPQGWVHTSTGQSVLPYDVNAIFMPAALDAFKLLGFEVGHLNRHWNYEKIRQYFINEYDIDQTRIAINIYEQLRQIPIKTAMTTLTKKTKFPAVSLFNTTNNKEYQPTPIMHSDDSLALLLLNPSLNVLEEIIDTTFKPFPAGLYTSAGVIVANPCFASLGLYNIKQLTTNDQYWKYNLVLNFNENEYHGTVVWSWQHAILAAGLERQIQRTDLTNTLQTKLLEAQHMLWNLINTTKSQHHSEWWSFKYDGNNIAIKDQHTSNPAQLWSTVFLALQEPWQQQKDLEPILDL